MQIFILDEDFKKNVQYHMDSHVVKGILESAQLLSNAVRLSGIDEGYKPTHIHHPCSKWVCNSLSNWQWLWCLVQALNDEWKYRYEHIRNHKSIYIVNKLPEPNIADIGLTPFALAMPADCKSNNAVESYRKYYREHKQHLASWKKRGKPEWY